jgi:hypothetical protein
MVSITWKPLILNAAMLNVIILNVIMLSVMALPTATSVSCTCLASMGFRQQIELFLNFVPSPQHDRGTVESNLRYF